MAKKNSLQQKYFFVLASMITGLLIFYGALEMRFAFVENKNRIAELQAGMVSAAASQVESFVKSIRLQLADSESLPWSSGLLSIEDRRLEFQRILRLTPSIVEISRIDANGAEELFVSRIELDRVRSGKKSPWTDLSRLYASLNRVMVKTYFRDNLAPHAILMEKASVGEGPATLAEVNLQFVADLVRGIKVGEAGIAYVVDSDGVLVAHPNINLVLGKTNLSSHPPFRSASSKLRDAQTVHEVVPDASGNIKEGDNRQVRLVKSAGIESGTVLTSAAPIADTGWWMFVEQPASEIMRPVYDSLNRTFWFLILGLIAAVPASYLLARALAAPILVLRDGARRIASGELDAHINVQTGDEIESLATEFNKMASQLQSYTTSLEQKVSEKTAQLELANRHKSEFLANMSHELRTPLNAVIGFSEALNAEYFGKLNPKQQEYVKDIHESGEHLLSLINDILDLSKIEAGHMELELSTFSLPTAIENAFVLVRERATRKQLQLRETIAPDVGDVVADQRKIKQVLINLLTNAVKFSHPNGWVDVVVRRDTLGADGVVVTVKDAGIGIAPENHASIFQEFQQVKVTGSAKQEGTGLGLSLVKRLVALHGGRVWVESALGQGASFSFSLPEGLPVENGIGDKQTPTGERGRALPSPGEGI